MGITAAVTLAIAVLGAVLGVINTCQSIRRDLVRLRVTPKYYVSVVDGGVLTSSDFGNHNSDLYKRNPGFEERVNDFCIEVVNVGLLSVVVSEIGFFMRGTKDRGAIEVVGKMIIDGGKWPRKLASRELVTIFMPPLARSEIPYPKLRCAYVTTDCGLTFKGTSKAFKQIVRRSKIATKCKENKT